MATIARVLSLAFPVSQAGIETLKVIATFCGVGLVVSLLLATYGLDISVGFFLTAAVKLSSCAAYTARTFSRLASAWHGSCECFRKNTRGRSRCAKSAHLERAK